MDFLFRSDINSIQNIQFTKLFLKLFVEIFLLNILSHLPAICSWVKFSVFASVAYNFVLVIINNLISHDSPHEYIIKIYINNIFNQVKYLLFRSDNYLFPLN